MNVYSCTWFYKSGLVSAPTPREAQIKFKLMCCISEEQQHHIEVTLSTKRLYNLMDKNTELWLSRWPSRAGAPALYSEDRADAVEFELDDFQKLVGTWITLEPTALV